MTQSQSNSSPHSKTRCWQNRSSNTEHQLVQCSEKLGMTNMHGYWKSQSWGKGVLGRNIFRDTVKLKLLYTVLIPLLQWQHCTIAPCLTDALLQEEQVMELISSYLIGADCYSEIIETTAEFNMVSPPVTLSSVFHGCYLIWKLFDFLPFSFVPLVATSWSVLYC